MVVQLVQGRRLIGASATVSDQARSNIGCAVGSVGRLDTRRWSVLLVSRAETWPRRLTRRSLNPRGLKRCP